MDSYSRWLKAVWQRAQPADNELTTKSQLLSSKRVIASAMLSIPVQAYEREKHMEWENRIVTHTAAIRAATIQ